MIKSIEIKYFRSIYQAKITDIKDINIITGKNDVGKSNFIRAMNLFFNNCINVPDDFDFYENFNLKRLTESKTRKRKQQIVISITFERGKGYTRTLPDSFTITKRWYRDSNEPIVSDDIESRLRAEHKKYTGSVKASLTKYLNRIRFINIPAVKDNNIFFSLMKMLQENIYVQELNESKEISELTNKMNESIDSVTKELSEDYYKATHIKSSIEMPSSFATLYKSLQVSTNTTDGDVVLDNRGDGFRTRYIPAILNYIAKNSRFEYIWGFEEPENSLEFGLASEMADDFYNIYRNNSLIFITTHSAAFVEIGNKKNAEGFRCYFDGSTHISTYKDAIGFPELEEELGYAKLLGKQFEEYLELKERNRKLDEEVEGLLSILSNSNIKSHKPVLLTEGKTDEMHLKAARKTLKNVAKNIVIKGLHGDDELAKLLLGLRNINPSKKIIGMFDRDSVDSIKKKDDIFENIDSEKFIKISTNVYAFIIPIARTDEYGKEISIEHYYTKDDLTKKKNGRRLFLANEFGKRGIGKDGQFYTKARGIDTKCNTSSIVDENVFRIKDVDGRHSVAMPKSDFADSMLNDKDFSSGVDFSEFKKIFDVINSIIWWDSIDIKNQHSCKKEEIKNEL